MTALELAAYLRSIREAYIPPRPPPLTPAIARRLLMVPVVLVGCAEVSTSDSRRPMAREAKAKAASAAQVAFAAQRAKVSATAAEARGTIARLRPCFTLQGDEVCGGGWFTHTSHTAGNSWNRNHLAAPVHSSGRVYLRSQYRGDDWLFHERIIVRIGERVIETQKIPTYDNSHVTHNSCGQVRETIHFTNDRDNGILNAIATAASRSPNHCAIRRRSVSTYDNAESAGQNRDPRIRGVPCRDSEAPGVLADVARQHTVSTS